MNYTVSQKKRAALFHGLRGIASPVLTATGFVNGQRQFSTPYRIETPQPTAKILVTGDYVGDPYSCAKLAAPRPRYGNFRFFNMAAAAVLDF